MSAKPEDIIDLEKYPIHELKSARGKELVEHCKAELAEINSSVLRGFLREDSKEGLQAEARVLAKDAFYYEKGGLNCYRTADDARFPEDHPRRLFYDVKEGVVAFDQFPADSTLRKLYAWQPLTDFLAAVFGKEALYPFDDPFQGLNLMAISENTSNMGMGWHFDENEFTITLMMQPPEEGGEFEYVPDIRNPWDENYRGVQRILQGDTTDVRREPPEYGMLALFRGGYSLHRVAPVRGKVQRLQCIATYEKKPGQKASDESSIAIYGPRVAKIIAERKANA
jgi:hypothetical protein